AFSLFFFYRSRHPRYLPSFPTRRSSDLILLVESVQAGNVPYQCEYLLGAQIDLYPFTGLETTQGQFIIVFPLTVLPLALEDYAALNSEPIVIRIVDQKRLEHQTGSLLLPENDRLAIGGARGPRNNCKDLHGSLLG